MRDTYLLPEVEELSVPRPGGHLAATLYRACGAPRAVAVLHPATGVPARFYAPFARWLAGARGVTCLTYDYRDFGASGMARGSRATMTDWGVHDQQAARDWLTLRFPEAPLWVIGHSLGGMMLPYQRRLAGISRVIAVAAGAVHLRDHPWPYQAFARAFWAPGVGALSDHLGYLPLRALRLGHDLPPGVYRQWRRWCLSRQFQGDDPALPVADPSQLRCPMRVVAVADDVLCPPATVWRLMQATPMAAKRQQVIQPEAAGVHRLGHLDVMGEAGRLAWPLIVGD